MLDLETIGTKPSAVVLSIGACVFDADGIYAQYYAPLNAKSQVDGGRKVDFDTICWWLKQGASAQKVFEESSMARPVSEELKEGFLPWCKNNDVKNALVMSNGIDFDVQIMESIFDTLKLETPWKFFNKRCYRTLKSTFRFEEGQTRQGTYHHALDDAIFQATSFQKFLKENPHLDR